MLDGPHVIPAHGVLLMLPPSRPQGRQHSGEIRVRRRGRADGGGIVNSLQHGQCVVLPTNSSVEQSNGSVNAAFSNGHQKSSEKDNTNDLVKNTRSERLTTESSEYLYPWLIWLTNLGGGAVALPKRINLHVAQLACEVHSRHARSQNGSGYGYIMDGNMRVQMMNNGP